MKTIILMLILLSVAYFSNFISFAFANQGNVDYLNIQKNFKIRKYSFLNVINQKEFSSETSDEGDIVTFINPCNIFVNDKIILPQGSVFIGIIEQIREPVQGANAAMKIKISKVVYPNNVAYKINAYVGDNPDQFIGGEMTNAMYYDKNPQYPRAWGKGVLQFVPVNVFEFGKHTKVLSGAQMRIVLIEDFYPIRLK